MSSNILIKDRKSIIIITCKKIDVSQKQTISSKLINKFDSYVNFVNVVFFYENFFRFPIHAVCNVDNFCKRRPVLCCRLEVYESWQALGVYVVADLLYTPDFEKNFPSLMSSKDRNNN